MQPRHLHHSEWTLAAIDDAIGRGRIDGIETGVGPLIREQPLETCDLDEMTLTEYRRLDPTRHDWNHVSQTCATIAADVFRRL